MKYVPDGFFASKLRGNRLDGLVYHRCSVHLPFIDRAHLHVAFPSL